MGDVVSADKPAELCNCDHNQAAHDQGFCRFCRCGGFVPWGSE